MTKQEGIEFGQAWLELNEDCEDSRTYEFINMAIKALEQEHCEDSISRGVFEQVMWERDVAIGQLKELGYEFGAKIEPCEDAISRTEVIKAIDEREDVNGKVDAESVRTDIVLMPPVKSQTICEEREKGECPYYAG